ncbi:Tolloid-like protein 1 [Actinoplanes hulinensis]|uniref:Tolloid-like protein 1 n=1 Tax=Actinoplanes hulinensis TaxID=1144547 RepID=A0ABS7B948_9ACTN|nr:M12 family metallopeptidase [Actinoplanes hulinensis]MBW6437194.1 Tolloid-like protein 1 [Actinoplanes hulinensis]
MTTIKPCLTVYRLSDVYPSVPPRDRSRLSNNELALANDMRWETGQELRVRFLDGDPGFQERVEAIARTWLEYANLRFTFADQYTTELRVTFAGSEYSSYVGKEAYDIPQDRPTVRLGGLDTVTDPDEVRRVVLHEFGHAIGCVHEHSSPVAKIQWDETAVYAYYKQQYNWTEEEIRDNVLYRYTDDEVEATLDHDPDSIMQYAVPGVLTRDGTEIGWNTDLSAGDKAFIAAMYPYPAA